MRGIVVALILLAVVLFLLSTLTLSADAAETAPDVAVAGEVVEFISLRGGLLDRNNALEMATGVLVVSNEGGATATNLTVKAIDQEGTTIADLHVEGDEAPPTFSLDPSATTSLKLEFQWSTDMPRDGFLVVEGEQPGTSASIPFEVTVDVPGSVLLKPFIGYSIITLLFMLFVHRGIRARLRKADPSREIGWDTPIRTNDKWTFKDSWASILTSAGAILGTVIGATGFIGEFLPGFSSGNFVALNLFFGFLVLLAPIAWGAFARRDEGTYAGLLLSATITVIAVVGEIATLGMMLHRGGVPIWWPATLMTASLVLIGAYVWASLRDLATTDAGASRPALL